MAHISEVELGITKPGESVHIVIASEAINLSISLPDPLQIAHDILQAEANFCPCDLGSGEKEGYWHKATLIKPED